MVSKYCLRSIKTFFPPYHVGLSLVNILLLFIHFKNKNTTLVSNSPSVSIVHMIQNEFSNAVQNVSQNVAALFLVLVGVVPIFD